MHKCRAMRWRSRAIGFRIKQLMANRAAAFSGESGTAIRQIHFDRRRFPILGDRGISKPHEGWRVYLRLRAYLRASGRRVGMRDPDRTPRRVSLRSELELAAWAVAGTSAAGSSGSPVPAAARILWHGVFVPGYTRDILISPGLLFASTSPHLPLPLSFSLLFSSRSLHFVSSLRLSLYIYLSLFLCSSLPFNVVPTRNPPETNFSNQIGRLFEIWKQEERESLDEIVEQLIMCISLGGTVGIFPVKYFCLLHGRQEMDMRIVCRFWGLKVQEV